MAVQLLPLALTTVARVKDGFSTTATDDEITRKINHVSQRFMQRTGRVWTWHASQIVGDVDGSEYHKGTGTTWLHLRRRPITAIINVNLGLFTFSGGAPAWVGVNITDYQRTADWDLLGKFYRVGVWVKVCPEWDRITRTPDTRRSSVLDSIQVQYSAGYIMPPYDATADATYNPTGAACNFPFEDYAIREVRNLLSRTYAGKIDERTAGGWMQRWSDVRRPRAITMEFDYDTEAWLDSESQPAALFC